MLIEIGLIVAITVMIVSWLRIQATQPSTEEFVQSLRDAHPLHERGEIPSDKHVRQFCQCSICLGSFACDGEVKE